MIIQMSKQMTVDTKRLRELLADPEKFEDALADSCGTGWDFVRPGDMHNAVLEVCALPSLLDEVERLRAENEELAEYKAMYEGLCK